MGNTLVPLELLDDLFASNNILEQLLQVRRGIRAPLVVGIEVLRFERYFCRSCAGRQVRHPLLMVVLRDAEQVLQFTSVAEVGTIPGTRENLDSDVFGGICGGEILDFELVVHDFPQLVVIEILESECVLDRESAGQSWVHVLLTRQFSYQDL